MIQFLHRSLNVYTLFENKLFTCFKPNQEPVLSKQRAFLTERASKFFSLVEVAKDRIHKAVWKNT